MKFVHRKLSYCPGCQKFTTAHYLKNGYGCLCLNYISVDVGLANPDTDVNDFIQDYHRYAALAESGSLFYIGENK